MALHSLEYCLTCTARYIDALLKSSESMFTAAKIRNGCTYFANHLSANDYYAQGERVVGEWLGKGAESLGLSGEVRPEAF